MNMHAGSGGGSGGVEKCFETLKHRVECLQLSSRFEVRLYLVEIFSKHDMLIDGCLLCLSKLFAQVVKAFTNYFLQLEF